MSGQYVLTVGSVLRGDDAAGPMLAKMLTDAPLVAWSVIDGGQTPEDELAFIRRCAPERLIVVDAAEMGLEPGSVRHLRTGQVVDDYLITTHSLPLSFLLEELEALCEDLDFIGIQPASLEFFGPLHPQVQKALAQIYACLAEGGDLGCFACLDDPDDG